MKKILVIILIILLAFTFNVMAQEADELNTEEENLDTLDLSQEKAFSESAREELLGIASQYDSQTAVDNIEIDSRSFNLTGNGSEENPGLQLLSDLNFNTDYDQTILDDEIKSETQLQLEYAINSRALIRAGYTLANREWWEMQHLSAESTNVGAANDLSITSEYLTPVERTEEVFREESESSRSIGLAYQTSDRLTVSADYIENNQLETFDDTDLNGNSTVFGLQYTDPMGTIRASYQLDLGDELTQRITGVELDFNNLATFSASYKLLDLNQLTDDLNQQKTAWDLGIGVNISEDYGLALGYELIEGEDEEEAEKKIRASFEIDF